MLQRKLFPQLTKYLTSREAVVITGMRRAGKTTLLQELFHTLKNSNKLFLDLENPLNRKYFEEEDYDRILDNLSFLGIHPKKRSFIFLDEIQYCRSVPSIVKYLSDHFETKFFLTGSASFYLKNLFTESLAGRKRLFELYPLDFEEFLSFKSAKLHPPVAPLSSRAVYQKMQGFYEEYLQFGGFPAVVLKESSGEKITELRDIFTAYFNKEVLELGDFRKNQVIRDLILLLMDRVGSRLEAAKLASELGVSRITIQEYLAFLEGTYLFSYVRPFSRRRDVEIRNAPKVYCVDSGFLQHLGQASQGAIFENAIFHQLRLKSKTLHYYQKKSGVEIDFIVDQAKAFEVKLHGRTQDANKLQRLTKELRLKKGTLISYRFVKEPEVLYGFQCY